MGFTRTRIGQDGVARYQALYSDIKGGRRSAGTFPTVERAERAWQRAEERLAEGRLGDARRGRQKFERYVDEQWFPNHEIEARTRENYTYYLARYIKPTFGSMRMVEILPADVRGWVADLKRTGASPTVIRSCFAILSAVFTTALNDQVTQLHPCRGVKTPPVPKKLRAIVTPQQFDDIYDNLPNDAARLLIEIDIESGLRWGELIELRPIDIDFATRVLTVRRVAVELVPRFHPEGQRFLVKEYPKDREHRRLKLSAEICSKIKEHVLARCIGDEELLFPISDLEPAKANVTAKTDGLTDFGLTEPNATGHQYPHGSITAYSAGRCRCHLCRGAYATYRADRRAVGKDSPRMPRRRADIDGHLPRRWFREHIWLPAIRGADLKTHVRPHDLRHAHASWLLAGGADLQVVKERLGHGTIATTEKYLHTLADADETALDALSAIRRTRPSAGP
jgi:integrase